MERSDISNDSREPYHPIDDDGPTGEHPKPTLPEIHEAFADLVHSKSAPPPVPTEKTITQMITNDFIDDDIDDWLEETKPQG